MAAQGPRAAPLFERYHLAAELELVGVIADGEIVNAVTGLDRAADRILDRQQAGGEPRMARDVEADHQHRIDALLRQPELHGDRLARKRKAFRARRAVLSALDRHSAVKPEDRLVVEQSAAPIALKRALR